MESSTDIKDMLTPLSMGSNLYHPTLNYWKPKISTSTPISSNSFDNNKQLRQLHSNLLDRYSLGNTSSCSSDPTVSPILFVQPKVNLASVPIFARRDSIDTGYLSTTGVASTLEKMELCENNNENTSKNVHNLKKDIITEDVAEESSSAHENFKRQINKNKKRKSISTKNKSPKVYKTSHGKKIIGSAGSSKKITNSNQHKTPIEAKKKILKSPKIKSPKTKVQSSKKVVSSGTLQGQQNKLSIKKSPIRNGSQCPTLKVSKCIRSPKLHTAARAKIKHQREEIRKEKEKQMEELRAKELEEQKRREELEAIKIRQQTVFKAKPIRKYAPLPPVKKRAVTDPISPNISKRRRIDYSENNSK